MDLQRQRSLWNIDSYSVALNLEVGYIRMTICFNIYPGKIKKKKMFTKIYLTFDNILQYISIGHPASSMKHL